MPAVENPAVLGRMTLFEGLRESELASLNDQLHRKTFPAGSNVITVAQSIRKGTVFRTGAIRG